MYNILSTMFTSIGESKIPLGLLIFSSILNIFMDLWMVAGLGLGVFGAALATLIAQGISAVFSFLIFFYRMRRYKSPLTGLTAGVAFHASHCCSIGSSAVYSVHRYDDRTGGGKSFRYTGTCRICSDDAGGECFFMIFVSIGNAVSPYVSQNLGANKIERIKKGYHAALVLDVCFAALAFCH